MHCRSHMALALQPLNSSSTLLHPPFAGPNTRAAIIRAGLDDMRRLAKALYPTVR